MKHLILCVGLLLVLFVTASSQKQNFGLYYGNPVKLLRFYGIDTSDIPRVRQVFDSTDHIFNAASAIFLAQRGYTDIVPRLRFLFYHALEMSGWEGYDPDEYLYSIYLLNLSDAHQLALELLDTMKVWRQQHDRRYKEDDVVLAVRILLNLGDYSRYQDFDENEEIERLDTIGVKVKAMDFGMYVAFASQPSLRNTVYNRLRSFLSHPFIDVRSDVIFTLNEHFRDFAETQQILRDVANSDPNLGIRLEACNYLSQFYNDPFAIQVCEQIAPIAKDTSSFLEVIDCLDFFPSPHALAALNRLRPIVSPPRGLNNYLQHTIRDYKPPSPKESVPITTMIDTLGAFVQQCASLGWLGGPSYVARLNQYISDAKIPLPTTADSIRTAQRIRQFQQALDQEYHDSLNTTSDFVTVEGWKFLYYNAQYILDRLPVPPAGFIVKLVSSTGTKLTGGALQYYEGAWKDATSNNDGTFTIATTAKTLSLRMTYEYGTQTKSNVSVGTDTIVFQTVNAIVQLQDSRGNLIDTGTVQYYAGAWRSFGTTTNGIATKELLPSNYSFRMTYAFASKDKQQDIGTNPIVVFQTVNAAVQLQDSQGNLINPGTVQYYSGAWRDFGVTTNGVATKELLLGNYGFRMTYAFASKDKQQDIGTNSIVVFQTVNAAVQLQNSQGNLMDQGTVQYYSGAWRSFGVTTNGIANKELLPNNYSFRMTYAYASKDKQQDIGTNATVVFRTVNAAVQLQNSQGNLIDQGTVQYYSGAWRDFGFTTNGVSNKELLPNNYTFRITYAFVSNDKSQDLFANNTISFSTVLCTIRVKNSQSQPVDNALASYYSGAWRQIGNTINGEVTKELLPANLSFRIKYGTTQQDKTQNLSTNNLVEFTVQ